MHAAEHIDGPVAAAFAAALASDTDLARPPPKEIPASGLAAM
jgi:hypothetical protein